MAPRHVFGVTGWSGSGKTTLIEALIPLLTARGVTVSTVKHAHHAFEIDRPGKDSFRHRRAGAAEVMIASRHRWALMREIGEGEPEPPLQALLDRMAPVDLVLVEGFRSLPIAKLEVVGPQDDRQPRYGDDPHIVAVVSDRDWPACPVPVLPRDAVDRIAALILDHIGLGHGDRMSAPAATPA